MSKQNKKRVFVTGGGTGGHIYPAVAICDYLHDLDEYEIFYVGNPENMEFSIVQNKGYEFLPVKVTGMPRKIGLGLICWFLKLFWAIMCALYYVLKYRPSLVFGTGGYVSAPMLFAVCLLKPLRVPYVLHDCDAQPGLVTRKFASGARKVSLAFDSAKKYINNENTVVFGNPIRKDFKQLTKVLARESLNLKNVFTVCITGGSQGAESINKAAVEILKRLSENNIQVIFQTGKKNYENVLELLEKIYPEYKTDKNLIIKPFFTDMAKILKSSDVVVSRAGSLSISEICAVPAAAILVPYPYAAADHQRKNAKSLADKNAALYVEDDCLNSEMLLEKILTLVNDKEQLCKITQNALKLANYDAVEDIGLLLNDIIKKN